MTNVTLSRTGMPTHGLLAMTLMAGGFHMALPELTAPLRHTPPGQSTTFPWQGGSSHGGVVVTVGRPEESRHVSVQSAFARLAAQQVALPAEYAQLIEDNLWDLV